MRDARAASCLSLAIMLTACGNGGAGLTFNLRWVGSVTPQDQAACGPPTQATMTRRDNKFTFTPNDGVLVIAGVIDDDGHAHGTLAMVGADHHPFPLTLDGTLSQDGFQGTYTSPRCQSRVVLHLPA